MNDFAVGSAGCRHTNTSHPLLAPPPAGWAARTTRYAKNNSGFSLQLDPNWEWFKDQTGMYGIKWDGWKDGRYATATQQSMTSRRDWRQLLAVGVNCQAFKIAWNQDDKNKAWTAWEYPISRSVSEQIMLKLCEDDR